MSWWDASGLTSFASNVVKSAQKKIDKVLDIDEPGGGATAKRASAKEKKAPENEGDFWNTWLGSPGEKAATESPSTQTSSGRTASVATSLTSSWRSWGFDESVRGSEESAGGQVTSQPLSPRQLSKMGSGDTQKVTPKSARQKPRQKTPIKNIQTEKEPDVKTADESSCVADVSGNVIDRDPVVSGHSDVSVAISSEVQDSDSGVVRQVEEKNVEGQEESGVLIQDVTPDQPHPPGDTAVGEGRDEQSLDLPSHPVQGDMAVGRQELDAQRTIDTFDSQAHTGSVGQGGFTGDTGDTAELTAVIDTSKSATPELAAEEDTSSSDTPVVTQGPVVQDSPLCDVQEETVHSDSDQKTQMCADVIDDELQIGVTENVVESVKVEGTGVSGPADGVPLTEEVGEGDMGEDTPKSVEVSADITEDESAQVRGVECESGVRETHLDSVTEAPRQCEISGGLSVITEDGSETESLSDDLVTNQARTCDTSQVSESESMLEISVSDRQVSSLLAIADPVLDKTASSCSSIEFLSETEIEKARFSKEPTKGGIADMDLSDLQPEGADPAQEQSDSSDVSHLDSSVDTCVPVEAVSHSGGDISDEPPEDRRSEKDTELAFSDGGSMTVSSSSSVVKTMLEEAMEDSLKHEECDSHSHSSSDKSDFVKSEFSDKSISGHESGDEIDTTTSSDIEIISTPTPNGDRQERPFDLSPLKIALSRASRRGSPKHRRSDSQSSSSTNSKPEQLSPGRDLEFAEDGGEALIDLSGHYPQGATGEHGQCKAGRGLDGSGQTSGETRNNPYDTDKLLKVSACVPETDASSTPEGSLGESSPQGDDTCVTRPTTGQTKEWAQKMAEMAEVINARENKLVQLSKENNDLMEANSILRNQLKQSEETRESEMEDLNILTEEFTQRLGEAERVLQMSLKEKESLKKQLEVTQVEMVKKGDTSKFQRMLAEKDEQLQELLAEGEKLSKQQLQSNTIIKKLRSKEKENEQLMQGQKKKLESQSTELEHLKVVLDSKEDMEKKQSDAIGQLNSAVQHQEKEIARLKGELEDNQEKIRGMQTALDTSYKEIAELHRANAAKDSQAQEVAVSAEMQAREELRFTMERENQRYRQEKEGLIMQIEDFRISLSRMEKEHGRREDMLRQEISDLQQRLQEDEARNQELTQSVTSATRPLLRQIENLQSTYMAQSTSWETVEKNITDRLVEAQTQLALAVEKERLASEKGLELGAQLATLEAQNARYRQDKSQMTAQLEMAKTKIEMLEDVKDSERAQVEAVRQNLTQDISELKREKILLENHLEMEKTKVENEKKKVALLQDQLHDKEKERPRSRGTPSPAQMTRQESVSSVPDPLTQLPTFTQEELLERSLLMAPHSPNGNKMTLYESLRQTGAATLLESLTSQLKQREGEITQLQSEISALERTRESMARELVNLSTQNDDLRDQIDGLPQLEAKHQDLEQRYNALLQMYGEKVEETEELKLDLQDVKELYKSQIDHLMKGH